jgi:N-carbamoylputrescine amidase
MRRNIQRAVEMAEVAAGKDAKIICYPELFLTPWFPREEEKAHLSLAIAATSEALHRFKQLSEETGTVLIIPFFESANGKYYNSAAVMDNGNLLGVYRKIHLPDLSLYRERFYFSPGDAGLPVFETSQGKIGVQICWDNLFPEGARVLALRGAEIVFAPTAAALNTHSLWERAISANAFANNIFIFRVNRVGQEEGITFYGRSFCVDPWGEMASELAGGKEAVVLADIDCNERDTATETWGFLKHRRPGEYGDLIK